MEKVDVSSPGSSGSKQFRRPKVRELLWPTLVTLKGLGGSASNEELLAQVIEQGPNLLDATILPKSEDQQAQFSYALGWTRTYLKKIGSIENKSAGVWSITKSGEAVSASEVATLFQKQLEKEAQLRSEKRQLGTAASDDEKDLEGENDGAVTDWKSQLLDVLRKLSPDAFERLAKRLLRESGFIKVEVVGRSGDGGIDGTGVLRVNLLSFQVVFQCKRYQGSVGASAIRDFRGAMIGRGDKGLMITTGTFTADATSEAVRAGAPAIDLIDGNRLCELLQGRQLGVKTETVPRVTVDSSFFDGM